MQFAEANFAVTIGFSGFAAKCHINVFKRLLGTVIQHNNRRTTANSKGVEYRVTTGWNKTYQQQHGGHTSNGQPDAAPITDQGLVNVASHCPNLRGVQLVNCDIDGSGLERMVAPKLISIDISHCDKLDAHYVAKFVQKQPQLEEFDIPDKGMSDYVLQCLVNSCPGLRRLGVAGCRDTTITWAAVQFPQLTHLSLHHGIGNEGLEVLAGCVPCLQTLEIERPSAEALLAACRRLPYLQEVRITAAREFRLNPSLLIELPQEVV